MSPSPTIGTHGFGGVHGAPLSHGGVVHGGNFVQHGAFVHGHGFVGPVHFFHPYLRVSPQREHRIRSVGRLPVRVSARVLQSVLYYPYYPYYYYNLYPPYGSVSSGADASSSGAVLDQTNMGGLSFEITPSNAELFVDNVRVGTRRRVQVDDATARFASGTPPCRDSRCRVPRRSVSMWISSPAR